MVSFKLEDRPDDLTGVQTPTLVRYEDGKEPEVWTTVTDLNRLFDTCSRRWERSGWDLEKLLTCINECEFE